MGLLDNAIREHLDLKRRSGADPAEVERLEREALGPVRRGPEDAEQAELAAEEDLAYAEDVEPHWDEGVEGGAPPPLSEPAQDAGPADAVPLEPPHVEEERPELAEPGASPTPAPDPAQALPERRSAPEHAGQETAEYDVAGQLEHQPPAEGEDMLEETPEFLQDTPDHDRLWFEQRPPRDFDFEG